MNKKGRYHTPEAEDFQDGSNDSVLANKLGITEPEKINQLEAETLLATLEHLIEVYDEDHRFTEQDLCSIHEYWLGDIYEWAGDYRTVNMSKDGFMFAASHMIPSLMDKFAKDCLASYTPCVFSDLKAVIEAISIVHVEFILIHPFRDGNGRIGRLLMTLMALQAGLPLLDFSEITGSKRDTYFSAIQAGLDCNYEPMQKVMELVLNNTLNKGSV